MQDQVETIASPWSKLVPPLLIATVLAACVIGGAPTAPDWRLMTACLLGAILIPLALTAGAGERFARLPRLTRFTLACIPLLPMTQLVPLPAGVWAALPGRDVSAEVFALIGASNGWHPISESPQQTTLALLALVPVCGAFLGALTLDAAWRRRMAAILLAFVGLSVLVGLIQFGTNGTALDFYNSSHRGSFLGFFANRNHHGLLIAIAAVHGIFLLKHHIRDRRLALSIALLATLVFLIAAVGTLSRAGIGLTVLGCVAAIYQCFLRGRLPRIVVAGGGSALAIAIALVTLSPTVQRAIDRFSSVAENERWTIWEHSFPLAVKYFPIGAGIGTYVESYAVVEKLENVTPFYYNRAHNDFLELVIETGLPGIALAILLIGIVLQRAVHFWRARGASGTLAPAASIALALVALHSTVDYPLRTEAIAVVAGYLLAVVLAEPAADRQRPAQSLRIAWTKAGALGILGQVALALAACTILYMRAATQPPIAPAENALANAEAEPLSQAESSQLRRLMVQRPLDQALLNRIYADESRKGMPREEGRQFLRLLRKMGWRDLATQQNLLFDAAQRNDLQGAMQHFDAILRRDKLTGAIYPLMVQLELDPQGREALAERLRGMPSWRASYFRYADHLADPAMVEARIAFLDYLQANGDTVSRAELVATLEAMKRGGWRAQIARIARSRGDGAGSDGLVFDPDFGRWAALPAAERAWRLPFEWQLSGDSGLSVEITVNDGAGELQARWNGRGAPVIARTMTFVRAGQSPLLDIGLGSIGALSDLEKFQFDLRCPGERPVRFISPGRLDASAMLARNSTVRFAPEGQALCDYPDLVIAARPQTIDRGADLSLGLVSLTGG